MGIKKHHLVWTAVVIAVVAVICGVCAVAGFNLLGPYLEKPGEGAKAETGYQNAERIISALERYHADKGSYPDTLQTLIPVYLDKIPAAPQPSYDWEYRVKDARYLLTFRYVGPCMNQCTYGSDNPKWTCSGYC
jgi:hypothetical protein